jgi:hypothetical protein
MAQTINIEAMKQITITVFDLFVIVFATIGFILIVGKLLEILFPEPAPVVQVTFNLPESKRKELTAGDHVKGLLKIGWDKLVEGVVSVALPWKK